MRPIVWLIGVLALSQLAGCASLSTPAGNANDQIDHWLSQHEYGKALAVLTSAKEPPSAATNDLERLHEKITAHIASYEQEAMAGADRAVAANDWGTAFSLYREGLSRLPDSTRLQQGQQRLLQRYAEHLDALELERLIARGEWTLKDLEVSRLAVANNPNDWLGRYSLSRKTAGANELALELAKHGQRALERKDLALARRIMPLAVSLSNTTESKALSGRLQDALRDEEGRNAHDRERQGERPSERQSEKERPAAGGQEQKKATRLMADFRVACREKNLAEAQQLMTQLEKQGFNTPEFRKLKKQVARDIAREAKRLIDTGATLYSQQRYEEALDVWKQAQALDPKNEQLTARIKRVTRVLENLQNLRNKNTATP